MFFIDFKNSIVSYGKAFKLISKLKLWKYFFIPAIIGLFVGVTIVWFALSMSETLGAHLASYYPFEFLKGFIEVLSQVLSGLFMLFIGLMFYKHVVMAFSSPFMGPVSEKIEEYLTGKQIEPNSFMVLLTRGIRINIRNLIKELLYVLPLLLLGFIPIVGLITTPFIFYIQSYYAGFGNMDYTLERYFNYSESTSFVKKYKGIAVGNGLVFICMLFIPLFGIILTLPVSTAASTIETLKKLDLEGKVKLLEV